MLTAADDLSPAELAEVTGKRRAAAQAAALAKLGVPFVFLGRAQLAPAVRAYRAAASAVPIQPGHWRVVEDAHPSRRALPARETAAPATSATTAAAGDPSA